MSLIYLMRIGGLRMLSSDSSATVRAYAARMMAMSGHFLDGNIVAPLLIDLDSRVRLWAVRILEQQPNQTSRLVELVKDEAIWVHFAAMETLLDLAHQDSSIYDDLLLTAKSGNIQVAELFNWAPGERKQEIVQFYRN